MDEQTIRSLVCELCRQFYTLGWVTGTGGSISIRQEDRIFMTPSGVQKERIKPEELFVVNLKGEILHTPDAKDGKIAPKLSDCAPLFLHAYNIRNAGAVLHSHGLYCNLVTLLYQGQSEFRITQQEMIKGIDGHGYYDDLVIPIIENTAYEHELADSLGEAISKYPKAVAVLVRQHGMYVWGKTWEQAKRHGECLHYLFESCVKAHELELEQMIAPHSTVAKRRRLNPTALTTIGFENALSFTHAIFDIEGTVAPISFVKETLFPYSTQHAHTYLTQHWSKSTTKTAVADLLALYASDQQSGNVSGLPTTPAQLSTDASAEDSTELLRFLVDYVTLLVQQDHKVAPLKQLQGFIWQAGYESGQLTAPLFDDVPRNLRRLQSQHCKNYIYSSGSRQAQHLLFKYSNHGDMRGCLEGYFDTKVGAKQQAESYTEILQTLGVLSSEAKNVLFVTDILAEAQAAHAAGLTAYLADRPGNAPVPAETHSFKVIKSLDEI